MHLGVTRMLCAAGLIRARRAARAGMVLRTTVLALLALVWTVAANGQLPAQHLVLLPGGDAPDAQPTARVLASDDTGLLLELELPALEHARVEVAGESFDLLAIPGGGFTGDVGAPMLPTFSRFVRVPDRAGLRVEVIAAETTEVPNLRPFPMQDRDEANFALDRLAYARDGYGPVERTVAGDPALARGVRLVPLTFQPVRYDPARRTVEVATRLQVRVRFEGLDLRNSPSGRERPVARSFDKIFRRLVVNYEPGRMPSDQSLGLNLMICPDDASVVEALEPLLAWRARKGFEVVLATTAETGATAQAIQDYIQQAYDTWESPPEYITLVGDVSGAVGLPCWFESYSSYHGETDHPYVQLEGDDLLADAHVGRISVDSVDRLRLYVHKIVGYESTPYMAETDWYERACLVGDPGVSGYTCVQIMQWLKSRLVDWGYAEVDTVFNAPFVSQMTSKLNRGDTVFSYRGYYQMSGFTNSNISGLQNGWKMPFAVNLTCDTGSFASGTARSEAWIRAGLVGTPPIPTGGIASIGTATIGTHTRFNNCVSYGIWRGVFWEDLFRFGEALTRAKYELYVNYGAYSFINAALFTHWNNLMGDPAGEIWTGVPQETSVDHPATLSWGANAVTIGVTSGGAPCADAYVCLYKEGETQAGGVTGADGLVEIALDPVSTGTLLVTVTKHDHQPYLGQIEIVTGEVFAGYTAHGIDDDREGTSSGNSDALPNPTERIELPVQVRNYGPTLLPAVTAQVIADDPYLTLHDDQEEFGDLPAGAQAWSADDFDIEIDAGAPDGHVLRLGLEVSSGGDAWHSLIEFPVVAAAFAFHDYFLHGFSGNQIQPGSTGEISLQIRNVGHAQGSQVAGTLVSNSPIITVTDASGAFGLIAQGALGENAFDYFGLEVSSAAFPGQQAPMELLLDFSGGARDTVAFTLPIGPSHTDDPAGPDAHGYFAFDNTDIGYPQAPTYDWVELDPLFGGAGTSLEMSDYGDAQDESKTLDLPFPFTYYGETYTRITVCTNGWIAMGSTYLTNYRNWNIPAAGAPPNLIAPMWDNLYQGDDSQIYCLYDEPNQRFIVQWSRMFNDYNHALENFEVILYNPAYHTSETGDGFILFQYETFNNGDALQHYCTVGIQNEDQTDGLAYSYYNQYAPGAATITSGTAIRFAALSNVERGALRGAITNATNNGSPVPGALVRVLETGETLMSGPDGVYGGALQVGLVTLAVLHPSFAPDTTGPIEIVEGETTEVDFALVDVQGPQFEDTTDHGVTADTEGPYEIFTTMTDFSELAEMVVRYNVQGAGWNDVLLVPQGNYVYKGSIPGQPFMSLIHYYIYARDVGGNEGFDPPGAPGEVYSFWVLPPALEDDMEAGAGGWTHDALPPCVDQWHLSQEQNHTAGGSWSWKFGDPGAGVYADSSDGVLISEPIEIAEAATLSFWHRIEAEESGMYPGQAYDGGRIEASLDGGDWQIVTPTGGYSHVVRVRPLGPGPFAAGTPCFSGAFDWTQEAIDLSGLQGVLQFRFRFGSDYAVGYEGWFIDDVIIISDHPGYTGARDPEARPLRIALAQNAPNPFSRQADATRIGFDLPHAGLVGLRIVDLSGRLVRSLIDGPLPAGRHVVAWDGSDGRGRHVPGGVYFYILDVEGRSIARRMHVLR